MPIEMRTGAVYTLEAGCIVRMVPYIEPGHAFKVVGLALPLKP
jgi:hypothetical protein